MPEFVPERKVSYQAQSNLNALALAAFVTGNPDAFIGDDPDSIIGRRFYDDDSGLNYEVLFLWLNNGRVTVFSAWVDDEGIITKYHKAYFNFAAVTWIPLS